MFAGTGSTELGRRLRTSAAASVTMLTMLAAACGADEPPVASPPSAPSTVPTVALGNECSVPGDGYRIRFPSSWHTAHSSEGSSCRFFNPEPFTLPPSSEATGVAMTVQRVPMPLLEIVPEEGSSVATDVVDRRVTSVSRRMAVRIDGRSTGRALLPRGTRSITWYVDFPGGTLVASTNELARDGSLATNAAVLDAMVASVEPIEGPACSATGLVWPPSPQELPEAVGNARAAIVERATRCDYEALAALALEGQAFTYSFGQSGQPAAYWREAEAAGRGILQRLVEILRLRGATRRVGATTHYVWPSAYAYDRWTDVPQPDRDALGTVYSEAEIRQFAQFGSYTGHRVGITASGDWLFFVAGD